jgi:anthraniloyl-CoA monooxygenase
MKISVIGGGPGGLYLAILAKKHWPDWTIEVFERNRADDTFGFGVVFSDQTLGFLDEYDNPSYESIRRSFAYWDDVDVHYNGRVLRCAGNGFCGCSRLTLLQLLHERATSLEVALNFEHEIEDESQLADSDLIVAADGLASLIRTKYENEFGTEINTRSNYFCWLGRVRSTLLSIFSVKRNTALLSCTLINTKAEKVLGYVKCSRGLGTGLDLAPCKRTTTLAN